MASLVKLALESGHVCYCLIVVLTLSQNLRRRSSIWSNRELVAMTHSQRFCKPSQVFFNSNIDTPISVRLNRISTGSSSIHWGPWGRVFDRSAFIFGSIVMIKFRNDWLEFAVNSLLLKHGVWSTIALWWLANIDTARGFNYILWEIVWDIVAVECRILPVEKMSGNLVT